MYIYPLYLIRQQCIFNDLPDFVPCVYGKNCPKFVMPLIFIVFCSHFTHYLDFRATWNDQHSFLSKQLILWIISSLGSIKSCILVSQFSLINFLTAFFYHICQSMIIEKVKPNIVFRVNLFQRQLLALVGVKKVGSSTDLFIP